MRSGAWNSPHLRILATVATVAGGSFGCGAGCGSAAERAGSVVTRPPGVEVPRPAAVTESSPPSTRPRQDSCALAEPEVRDARLSEIRRIGQLEGRSWLLTYGAQNRWSLTCIGADGQLAYSPLPLAPDHIAVQSPSVVRFLATGDNPRPTVQNKERRWWTVDVSDPDRPRSTESTRVEGIEPWEYVRSFAADSTRALIAMARTPPAGGGPQQGTALFEVPSGKRISALAPFEVVKAQCHRGRCYGLAPSPADSMAVELVRFDDAGHKVLQRLGRSECPHAYGGYREVPTWRVGARWWLAWSVGPEVRLLQVDLETGSANITPLAPAMGECPRLVAARLDGRHGLVVRGAGQAAFFPADGSSKPGGSVRLPPFQHHDLQLVPLGRGALVLDYSNATSMAGARSARGQVHWYVWSFDGEASLLRPHGTSAWQREDAATLPHHGESDRHGRGFEIFGLTRPGHAMVLMERRDTFGPGHVMVLRRPCDE